MYEFNGRRLKLGEFVSQLDFIRAGLKERYTVRAIWQTLRDREEITMSYSQFAVYVQRFINKKKEGEDDLRRSVVEKKKVQKTDTGKRSGIVKGRAEIPATFEIEEISIDDVFRIKQE